MATHIPYRNPQPTIPPDRDAVAPPGLVTLVRFETVVQGAGDIRVVDGRYLGQRKQIASTMGDNVVSGNNLEDEIALKKPGETVLLEWTGGAWRSLYHQKKEK